MNILLIGYGKMGKAIEEIAIERGHNISGKIDLSNATQLKSYLNKSDVAIEFTQPESAVNNIINCFENNVPVVVGTTGWYKEFEKVKDACKQLNGSILPATNFSIG
jgi:4-hydroxy-tetrahydrodipicolinate reductase